MGSLVIVNFGISAVARTARIITTFGATVLLAGMLSAAWTGSAAAQRAATPVAAVEAFHAALDSGDDAAAISLLDRELWVFECGFVITIGCQPRRKLRCIPFEDSTARSTLINLVNTHRVVFPAMYQDRMWSSRARGTQSVHLCWLEQMERVFVEFEPDPLGNSVLATETLDLSKCPPNQG